MLDKLDKLYMHLWNCYCNALLELFLASKNRLNKQHLEDSIFNEWYTFQVFRVP